MQKVPETPLIGKAPTRADITELTRFVYDLVRALLMLLYRIAYRLNRALPTDGSEAMTGPLPLASYAAASLPDAASYAGCVIYVPDGGAGSVFQGSNGTAWVSLG